jgi:D-alanine-D-alanine ligase
MKMRIGILSADASYEAARLNGAGPAGRAPGADHLARSLIRDQKTTAAVRTALEADGHQTLVITVDEAFLARLRDAHADLVFNTYFGPATRRDQAAVASFLEYVRVPFSGGGAACHFNGLSKPLTLRVLAHCGLPTPRFHMTDGKDGVAEVLGSLGTGYPLIVKAPEEGEGIGLDEHSVVRTDEQFREAVTRIVDCFGTSALVEEFLPGREFTVGVLDGPSTRILPILEIALGTASVYSYEAKTKESVQEICPADIAPEESTRLGTHALCAGKALGCRDFWRVDFRIDANGRPRILEVNTLPGLQPGYSDMVKMAEPAGMRYADIVQAILLSALNRVNASTGGEGEGQHP